MNYIKEKVVYFIPLIVILIFWEVMANFSTKVKFLFASPASITSKFIEKIGNGELIEHSYITGLEAFLGLILGVTIGSLIGFSLLYYPKVSKIAKPYILALSAIPIFGIAPMMIIWFGTDLSMKVAMAFFSTVFVAILQAYEGGKNVDKEVLNYFELNLATRRQKFIKFILPSSMSWVIQSLKLTSGLAILGAFIGEFIAAERGLGYIMLRAGGVYDIPYVLAAVICIILLTLFFNFLVGIIEKKKLSIIRFFAIE